MLYFLRGSFEKREQPQTPVDNPTRETALHPMRRKSYATHNSLCHTVYFHYTT